LQSPVNSESNLAAIGVSAPLSASVSWEDGANLSGTTAPQHMLRKVSVTFTDVNPGKQKSSCQIIIDWGDGARIKEVIAKKFLTRNFLISSQHVYQKAGKFQATLTILDSDGLQLTTNQAIVIPPAE
jgi:hypothetical protein